MNIEVVLSDKDLNDYAMKHAQLVIKQKVESYINSSAITNKITAFCDRALADLATETVMSDKIRAFMDKKTQEILPEALNDKFVGAYMSVVVSEARKQASIASSKLKIDLAANTNSD